MGVLDTAAMGILGKLLQQSNTQINAPVRTVRKVYDGANTPVANWTAPADVTFVKGYVLGAGGRGYTATNTNAGGGSGDEIPFSVNVTPGTTYTFSIAGPGPLADELPANVIGTAANNITAVGVSSNAMFWANGTSTIFALANGGKTGGTALTPISKAVYNNGTANINVIVDAVFPNNSAVGHVVSGANLLIVNTTNIYANTSWAAAKYDNGVSMTNAVPQIGTTGVNFIKLYPSGKGFYAFASTGLAPGAIYVSNNGANVRNLPKPPLNANANLVASSETDLWYLGGVVSSANAQVLTPAGTYYLNAVTNTATALPVPAANSFLLSVFAGGNFVAGINRNGAAGPTHYVAAWNGAGGWAYSAGKTDANLANFNGNAANTWGLGAAIPYGPFGGANYTGLRYGRTKAVASVWWWGQSTLWSGALMTLDGGNTYVSIVPGGTVLTQSWQDNGLTSPGAEVFAGGYAFGQSAGNIPYYYVNSTDSLVASAAAPLYNVGVNGNSVAVADDGSFFTAANANVGNVFTGINVSANLTAIGFALYGTNPNAVFANSQGVEYVVLAGNVSAPMNSVTPTGVYPIPLSSLISGNTPATSAFGTVAASGGSANSSLGGQGGNGGGHGGGAAFGTGTTNTYIPETVSTHGQTRGGSANAGRFPLIGEGGSGNVPGGPGAVILEYETRY